MLTNIFLGLMISHMSFTKKVTAGTKLDYFYNGQYKTVFGECVLCKLVSVLNQGNRDVIVKWLLKRKAQ